MPVLPFQIYFFVFCKKKNKESLTTPHLGRYYCQHVIKSTLPTVKGAFVNNTSGAVANVEFPYA